MCSMYWNLVTMVKCPHCGKRYKGDLQTHFMGSAGSCVNYYKLKEPVAELGDMSVTLDGNLDSFIEQCPRCEKFIDYGAKIIKGKVLKVWPLMSKEE